MNMLLEGRVPTPQEAILFFKNMREGKLPKPRPKKRMKSSFTGNWGSGVSRYQSPHPFTGSWGRHNLPCPTVKLVTPVAMDLEQAKSKLRQMGHNVDNKRKRSASTTKGKKKNKSPLKGSGKRGGSKKKNKRPIKGRGNKSKRQKSRRH